MNREFPPEEPEELQMRSVLSGALEDWLVGSGLTQTAAAAVLGTTQARISELKHGKTAGFSLDLLVRLAARADLRPAVSVTPRNIPGNTAGNTQGSGAGNA